MSNLLDKSSPEPPALGTNFKLYESLSTIKQWIFLLMSPSFLPATVNVEVDDHQLSVTVLFLD